ncbi:uncharacterized protein FTJAE_11237 [Fusarium tjaetaba]|uniref:Fungal N-terminal domain-containing protein n=1 Tax=Fusarium tjaetaba TaxID=1567544 RepID=A0A8H5QXB2_9HYPO|nr:uncharacterized protein FTJAE_11237 [Fusarium tjaetaba]KAF5621516.1 hypothetical protein FTJAE_11237 [Fusarium tjaetaba]
MAELALAIIPLGITVTSGLVKYLKAFNDHDDDRTRLLRQAERFASTFQSLEAALNRSQLDPELSASVSQASGCLKDCQKALEELDILQQKIFPATTSMVAATCPARTKNKIKDGYKKLIYPLRKSDIESLGGALDRLSTTLGLALEMLHIDEESLTRKILNEQMAEIQKSTIVNSNTATAIQELHQPITKIDLAVPVLQTSVDSIVPRVDQRLDQISYQISYQHVQMQAQIEALLDMAGPARYQDRLETNRQLSYNQSSEQGSQLTASEPELLTLCKRTESLSMCSCKRRRVRQRKRFALGPVHFTEEMLSNVWHEKDCVFFKLPSDYEKTRTIRFTGLASLLRKGIEVSFSTRFRAGVSSISPSFTYFPVVPVADARVAPAFLVMDLLYDAARLEDINETRSRIILNTVQRKIQELFCSGRASPNDVTEDGDTLLHALAESVWRSLITPEKANSPFVRLTCEGLVNFLGAAGTSVTARDNHGNLALHGFINGTFVPASIYGPLIAGNDVADLLSVHYSALSPRLEILKYHEHNPKVAEIQYGPLSLAVIRNNLPEVERLTSTQPHMLEELSVYRETPLHIAIHRPEILKTLTKKVNPEVWIPPDGYGATVLNYAMRASREICNPGKALDDSCCPCTLPLRIILASGCPIIPHRDFHPGYRGYFFEASPHCKTLLAKELRIRRQQLRDLALNKLSITELRNFTTLDEVPDLEAIGMDRLLRQKGILGLGPLSTFVNGYLPQRQGQDVRYYSRSIFFDLRTPEDADLFLDSGFKIISTDQDYTSSLDRTLHNQDWAWIRYISLEYAIWLFQHQAPLWKWHYRFTSPMPSVFVLADILGIEDYKCAGQDNISNRAEHHLFESVLIDKCYCLCSPDGCTPFTLRMKWLAHPHEQVEELTPHEYGTQFGSYAEIYGRCLSLSHHVIMVRQATFAALDFRHTCLDRPGYSCFSNDPNWVYFMGPVKELEPDEIELETLNVDGEAMNQLEEVVSMFQHLVLSGRQTTVSSKSDTLDIDYSAFNDPAALGIDELYYQRILEFWRHIWVDRIQVALDTVAKSWETKLDGQHDPVQLSTCEEAGEVTKGSKEFDDDAMFNRIIQRIQDI